MKNKAAKQMICDVIKNKYGYPKVMFSYDGYCRCVGKRNGKFEYLYLQYLTKPDNCIGISFKGIWEYKSLKFLGEI